MGHELPRPLWPKLVDLITANAAESPPSKPGRANTPQPGTYKPLPPAPASDRMTASTLDASGSWTAWGGAMLACYRILDLTDPPAWLCGLVLAQLGAEVVAVEPPGGHDCSGLRPAWREAYLRGRILLEGGRGEIAELAGGADAVVASGGIDLAALREADSRLVTVSITPWGETGPKAGWRSSDLVLAAAGGHVVLNGDA